MGDLGKLLCLLFILGLMAILISIPEKQDKPTVSDKQDGPRNGGAL